MDKWIKSIWEKRDSFITPVIIEKDQDYKNRLDCILTTLEKDLLSVGAEEYYIKYISSFKEKILDVIEKYYGGFILEAQNLIDDLVDQFLGHPLAVSKVKDSISFGAKGVELDVEFFRARCNEKIVDYKKEEMLHIPFSKRALVKTERFSIPGLPCLYLGTSSYVCWIELGRPADHMFNVSPVVLDNTQTILNLAINFRDFCSRIFSSEERKIIFRLFLLSITTSFKVREQNRNFKSEYIISQMIMLSCMKKGLSGIAYYSKQIEDDYFAYSVGVNLALFAYYSPGKELSDICNHLNVSDSFNYSMYKQLLAPQTFRQADLRVDHLASTQNIGTFERQYPYKETMFYKFDNYLYAYNSPTKLFNK